MGDSTPAGRGLEIQRRQDPLQDRGHQVIKYNKHDDRDIKQSQKAHQLQECRPESAIDHEK